MLVFVYNVDMANKNGNEYQSLFITGGFKMFAKTSLATRCQKPSVMSRFFIGDMND